MQGIKKAAARLIPGAAALIPYKYSLNPVRMASERCDVLS